MLPSRLIALASVVLVLCLAGGMGAVLPGQGKRDPTLDKLALEFAAAYTARDAEKVAAF